MGTEFPSPDPGTCALWQSFYDAAVKLEQNWGFHEVKFASRKRLCFVLRLCPPPNIFMLKCVFMKY